MNYVSPFSQWVGVVLGLTCLSSLFALVMTISSIDDSTLIKRLSRFSWILMAVMIGTSIFLGVMVHLDREGKEPVLLRTEIHRVKIYDIRPPKHFYVSFVDLTNNHDYHHHYVSKHCNSYRNLALGEEMNIQVNIYRGWDQNLYQIPIRLYETFC